MAAHDHARVFWAYVFKPFWILNAIITVSISPYRWMGNLFDYADSLWEMALDEVRFGGQLLSADEAFALDRQHWGD